MRRHKTYLRAIWRPLELFVHRPGASRLRGVGELVGAGHDPFAGVAAGILKDAKEPEDLHRPGLDSIVSVCMVRIEI